MRRAAGSGAVLTCRLPDGKLPLDQAIWTDDVDLVRALLEAKADPNARWSYYGDRFPLQGAVELRQFGRPAAHRLEMIQLLLDYGADPNQRWCPFETRDASSQWGCLSDGGIVASHWAASQGDGALTVELLAAGADPAIEDQFGTSPLDVARTEGVFYPLLQALGPAVTGRGHQVVSYLDARTSRSMYPGPWQETALSRAISGHLGNAGGSPPPPPPNTRYDYVSRSSYRIGRVRVLLDLGADPNQRLSWGGVDWTPLALAIAAQDAEVVVALLRHRAAVNARWCVPVDLRTDAQREPAPGCTPETGTTPLHHAADLRNADVVRALLTARPDVTLRDFRGETALDVARAHGHRTVLADLEAYAVEQSTPRSR